LIELYITGTLQKLPFGSREKFAKMTNTTLALVVLTWLRQLQEYFYKIGAPMKTETGMYKENIVPLKPNMCQENSLWTTCT
jgi:hypothetical protein